MNQLLLDLLCDPVDKAPLRLADEKLDERGAILEGTLISTSGRRYPIAGGVPRFVPDLVSAAAVASFGDEWNYFDFRDFESNWLEHTVHNTFGSTAAFRDKVVVDAGGGSGSQTRWIALAGARHVICLELSHSVDGVVRKNVEGLANVDVVQCSIDSPPLRDSSIDGMVICHNVIQHTRSVEDTARALWRIVAPGGEFVFNCYPKNDEGLVRKARLQLYFLLRKLISTRPFRIRLAYAQVMGFLRLVPLLGWFLEKSMFMVRGDVRPGPHYLKRCYKAGVLNTFDCYGAHAYQHLKGDGEIRELVRGLQPDANKVLNMERYFLRPPPIGIALRLRK